MADNKTKATTISVPAFLDTCVDVERRADAKALAKLRKNKDTRKLHEYLQ